MKLLLVGGGAREHAMAAAIDRSTEDVELLSVMAKRNPGIASLASEVLLEKETHVEAVVAWAKTQGVEMAVIGPEAPEEAGLTDALEAAGIPTASPTKAAARIETDKHFMRELMDKYQVPGRLGFHPFTDVEAACAFLDANGPVWAIKPIGLTGGKGVQVYGDHFQDVEGAKAYTRSVFESGAGGGQIQFEELAVGEEFTLMGLTDGTTVLPMVAAQDHKRLLDDDQGPNTGGMGSYSSADGLLPFLRRSEYDDAVVILQSLVDALAKEGCPYKGAIYGQFMLTASGPKVIEVNARFGDPEAMNVLHLLESDYVRLLRAICKETLNEHELHFRQAATVAIYLVPQGYGDGTPEAGHPIVLDEEAFDASGATLYLANTVEREEGGFETLTSRTMAVLGEGATLEEAHAQAEAGLAAIHSDGVRRRTDIGTPALLQRRVDNMAQVRA